MSLPLAAPVPLPPPVQVSERALPAIEAIHLAKEFWSYQRVGFRLARSTSVAGGSSIHLGK